MKKSKPKILNDTGNLEREIGHLVVNAEVKVDINEWLEKCDGNIEKCLVLWIEQDTGKLRRLDLDTIKILEMSGWRIYCQHRALLFEELEQADLFEGSKKQVKGRLSFFKRLSWRKGQPVASWEDILIAVRR